MDRKYLKLSEVPAVYGLSKSTLYRLRDRGELTIRKFGRLSLVRVDELEALIENTAA